jgi:hypothetical protein
MKPSVEQILQQAVMQGQRTEVALDRLADLLIANQPLFYPVDKALADRYALTLDQVKEICKEHGLTKPQRGKQTVIHRKDRERLDGIIERLRQEESAA